MTMIDYEWMVNNNSAARQAQKKWKDKEVKNFLYSFICLCKMGFTEQELRGFIDALLSNEDS